MDVKTVDTIQEAIREILVLNPGISRYRIAKDLNLSTSTHVSNYLNGVTKQCRPEVAEAILTKYNVRIKDEKR